MQVRTRLAWPWRLVFAGVFLAVVAGMWWWGFDFGQILGGFNRREVDAQVATLAADAATAQRDAASLRARNSQLDSDLAMMRGLTDSMQKQQAQVVQENTRLKEELTFFQQFFADASKTPGVGIQRLDIDTGGGEIARYSILLVRGSGVKQDFAGELVLQAEMVPTTAAPDGSKALTVLLPDERPESSPPMQLRFKYYQRLEGTFPIPSGYELRALTARVYETGSTGPKASRTLTFP